MAENNNGNGFLKQVQIAASGLIIAGVLGWAGISVGDLETRVAKMEVHQSYTQQKEAEIVPREENEKRYQSIENNIEDNRTRITRVESLIYTGIAGLPKGTQKAENH